jgi:hypothetical protein
MRIPTVRKALLPSIAGLCLAGALNAQVVLVSSDIATSTTWTHNNTYRLQQQIYVLPGATLTIEPGTIIASTAGVGGSLAVCRGAQIYANGTQQEPIIFTTTNDTATWTANNPKTGTWRNACNEWGNLTLMGAAFVSENIFVSNTAFPNGANYGEMEGLVAGGPNDTRIRYGGGNDYDSSGSISYVSLRYGGKVISLNNELNGLSLGGIGRGTDIHHVEIMNNIDDGVEIWGGTVNLKHVSIWNVGDDSFDVDQGWRGKAQFGLIVQGYCVTGPPAVGSVQGSGMSDNGFETDGGEQSDYQPVTTATIYNFTVIGQPFGSNSGDHATAWRDNARVQYRNCTFMDIGERVVSFDNVDGDGGAGYAFNGTLSWAATWTTAYNNYSAVNAPPSPAGFYQAQTSGNLAEITDSCFFNNTHASAYTEANNVGVFAPANNNVQSASSPIVSITREAANFTIQTTSMRRVLSLDPRPANDALVSVGSAPNDGFFTPAAYRGGFAPTVPTWLSGWTASQAYGLTVGPVPGAGQPGVLGSALFDVNDALNANGNAVGTPGDLNGPFFATATAGGSMTMTFNGALNQNIILLTGSILNPGHFDIGLLNPLLIGGGTVDVGNVPLGDFVFLADGSQPDFLSSLFRTGPTGTIHLTIPVNLPPATVLPLQAAIFYPGNPFIRMSNAVRLTVN